MASIKTGIRSLTDPILVCHKLKQYLLGSWLDALPVPPYIKVKSREIFETRKSFRTLYSPMTGSVDTAWLLEWPTLGTQILSFLATTIYSPTANEEYILRRSVKDSSTVEEILSWKPFCDSIAALKMEINRTVVPEEGAGNVLAQDELHGNDLACDMMEDEHDIDDGSSSSSSHALQESAQRLMHHMTAFLMEPDNATGMKDLIQQCPLTNMTGKAKNHVLVLIDTNIYGETDVQARARVCPIPRTFWQKTLRGTWSGRSRVGGSNSDQPEHMNDYEIYMCFDGGKDRKRQFKQQLTCDAREPKEHKMSVRDIMLWVSEDSWKLSWTHIYLLLFLHLQHSSIIYLSFPNPPSNLSFPLLFSPFSKKCTKKTVIIFFGVASPS